MWPVNSYLVSYVKQIFSVHLSLQRMLFYAVAYLFKVVSSAFHLSFQSHTLARPWTCHQPGFLHMPDLTMLIASVPCAYFPLHVPGRYWVLCLIKTTADAYLFERSRSQLSLFLRFCCCLQVRLSSWFCFFSTTLGEPLLSSRAGTQTSLTISCRKSCWSFSLPLPSWAREHGAHHLCLTWLLGLHRQADPASTSPEQELSAREPQPKPLSIENPSIELTYW